MGRSTTNIHRRKSVVVHLHLTACLVLCILLHSCCAIPIVQKKSSAILAKLRRRREGSPLSISPILAAQKGYPTIVFPLQYNTILHKIIAKIRTTFSAKDDECMYFSEKPIVRVEKAPNNSRRIYAIVDIEASVDEVWDLLTDYDNLQKFIPSLVANEVLARYSGSKKEVWQSQIRGGDDSSQVLDEPKTMNKQAKQCKISSKRMKGSVLKQVGGAKVMGINFSARTTLEVREWPMGMPKFAHHGGEDKGRKLERYVFPIPFTVSSLPHKDISMQSIEEDDGEFRLYQGVWRMQSLPGGSSTRGKNNTMRLTYAVEVSPRLPATLVQERLAQELSTNLEAIRDVCTKKKYR